MVCDWGPMAREVSVGDTKNPVQPTAIASSESAVISDSFHPKLSIVYPEAHNPFAEPAYKL